MEAKNQHIFVSCVHHNTKQTIFNNINFGIQ